MWYNFNFSTVNFKDKDKVPARLSGVDIGVEVQSAGGNEGRKVLKVDLFLSAEDLVTISTIIKLYDRYYQVIPAYLISEQLDNLIEEVLLIFSMNLASSSLY